MKQSCHDEEIALKPLNSEKNKCLLVVEDNEQDYEMFLRSIQNNSQNYNIIRFETGDEAWESLTRDESLDQRRVSGRTPALILLDLNLPGTDGQTILKRIKLDPHLASIPVVVFSTSSNPKDITECYKNRANGYVVKSMNIKSLQRCIEVLLQYWLDFNVTIADRLDIT